MSRTLLFLGDSNTYGYDPTNWYTLRYPREQRWTGLLERSMPPGWTLRAEGMNGRTLPRLPGDAAFLRGLLQRLGPEDCFAVMLGTNDLLLTWPPDAARAVCRMEVLLRFLLEEGRAPETLLVLAPPCLDRLARTMPAAERCGAESHRMNEGFGGLCQRFGVRYADTQAWEIDLSPADWVHFSAAGHRTFAAKLAELLRRW